MFVIPCGYLRAAMTYGEIPEPVLRFILDHIDSVPHLETLLLLWENPARGWHAAEVAERLYVTPDSARNVLADLARRGFIAADPDSGQTFRYDPGWDAEGELMRAVADNYRRRLVRMANLIHSKASAAVRDFARAFQFKD
jgi:DNA-binding IclR family transcriptional regulator